MGIKVGRWNGMPAGDAHQPLVFWEIAKMLRHSLWWGLRVQQARAV